MGLLGVVTTLAMWNSDGFESHMLHHSNHGVMVARQPEGLKEAVRFRLGAIKDESFAKVLSLIKDFASCFSATGFPRANAKTAVVVLSSLLWLKK